jgi:hypothetical protein
VKWCKLCWWFHREPHAIAPETIVVAAKFDKEDLDLTPEQIAAGFSAEGARMMREKDDRRRKRTG